MLEARKRKIHGLVRPQERNSLLIGVTITTMRVILFIFAAKFTRIYTKGQNFCPGRL